MIKIYIIIFFFILFTILNFINTKSKILELYKENYLVYSEQVDRKVPSQSCGPCRRCPPSAPTKVCEKIDMNLYMTINDKTICPKINMSQWIDKKKYNVLLKYHLTF